nr:hypothetical protein Hi04_10k_c3883_00025 [uncultured bacterium]
MNCRLCGGDALATFVDLGMQPLSNAYVNPGEADAPETFYPLHARVCERCLLVQLPALATPESIFREYAYLSSMSKSWLAHCERYATTMIERLSLGAKALVAEVASNDGYLLQYFKAAGVPVLGIEPAANIAKIAESRGIATRPEFFGSKLARALVEEGLRADLLIGNNVLAHVPDLNDFIKGLGIFLAPRGVLTMEFPHLTRLIDGNQFDTIYHEHFSYFSLATASKAFERHKLEVFDVEELPTHGGSLRVHVGHEKAHERRPSVSNLLAAEHEHRLDVIDGYRSFRPEVERVKRALLRFLTDAKESGKRVVGYGAAAKGNTLLNYCGIRTDLLDFVVDVNPLKQGRLLPGSRIPILPVEAISENRPDFVLVLPWNLKAEIAAQLTFVRSWGAKLVLPIPKLDVVS